MQTSRSTIIAVILAAAATVALADGFRPYPGATRYSPPDTPERREMLKALPPGTESIIYLSSDSFEKVVTYYKSVATQYTMPAMPGMPKVRKLPTGQELQQAYFIFDGAKDLTVSKSWAQIQRPYIGSVDENLQYHDVRDVTAITVSQKK